MVRIDGPQKPPAAPPSDPAKSPPKSPATTKGGPPADTFERQPEGGNLFHVGTGSSAAATSGSGGITQQAPVADPLKDGYSSQVKKELLDAVRTLETSPQLENLDPAAKKHVLLTIASNPPPTPERIAKTIELFGSKSVTSLPPASQQLLADTVRAGKASPELMANAKRLVESGAFGALGGPEKTAVLSQVKNYPDPRSVANLERLVGKDWFTSFPLGDKQRALKIVGHLSQHGGDRTIIDNTLGKFLDKNAPYKMTFTERDAYGSASLKNQALDLNRSYVEAGDGKLDVKNEDAMHLVTHTVPHEVNHLVNGDKVKKTYDYFMAEYGAYHTGFKAQHGREPTQAEMLVRARVLLSSTEGAYDRIRQALADPTEGPKIVDFMKKVLGRNDVTAANAATLAATNQGKAPAPRPDAVRNNDNH